MKKSIAIFLGVIVALIICATSYYFMFGGGKDNKVKEEYQKYVDMINISHDFEAGAKGLETLTTDVAQKVIPTFKTDIKVAKEVRNTSISLNNKKVDELGGMMLITADHGNAEELFDATTHQAKTSHTTNLVPCYFYDNTEFSQHYRLNNLPDAGLTNIAATLADLLISEHSEHWRDSLIELK